MIPTPGAPKSISELKELLKNDNKVKVAGEFSNCLAVHWCHTLDTGIDGKLTL